MQVFDTHCHLGLDADANGSEQVDAEHARARQAGVERLLVVGIDLASSQRARELAQRLPGVAWSAGLHPNSAGLLAAEWPGLKTLAATADCAAIGETGLDFFRDRTAPAEQEASLLEHAQLARTLNLPLILHCRDAYARICEVLRPFAPLLGVMHCFAGNIEAARAALDLGLHLSFAGPLTYPQNTALRAAAAFAPEQRLLVETDAPFLPPQGRRGQRNEPAFVLTTLATLASIRGLELAQAARLTWDNARALFPKAL